MEIGFVHSIKVPTLYKNAAQIVRSVMNFKGGVKDLLYTRVRSASMLRATYVIITKTIQHKPMIEEIERKCKILYENPRLDKFMAYILISEVCYGSGRIRGNSKPVETVRKYLPAIQEAFASLEESVPDPEIDEELRKPRYVRVNTLKATCDEVIKTLRGEGWELVHCTGDYSMFLDIVQNLSDVQFIRDRHVKDLLVFPAGSVFHNHPLYLDSTLILQDKASCMPAHVLSPTTTSTVLDMCAAPGMKTSLMSSLMRGKGALYAIERNERRYQSMVTMVKAAGCTNVTTIFGDSLALDADWTKDVDMVLVDPSCSGTGMTEKVKIFSNPQNPGRLKSLTGFQVKLLLHALTAFPAAKRVVYSTCSIQVDENEQVVADVLQRQHVFDQWQVMKIMPAWPSRGSSDYPFGECCITARPEEDLTTGFFIALFERKEPTVHAVKVEADEESSGNAPTKSNENKKRKRVAEKNYKSNDVIIKDDSSLIYPVKVENNQKESSVNEQDDQTIKSKKKKRKRDAEENHINNVVLDDSSLLCPVKVENDQKESSVNAQDDQAAKSNKKKKRRRDAEENHINNVPLDDSSLLFPVKVENDQKESSVNAQDDQTIKSDKKKKRKRDAEENYKNNVATDDTQDDQTTKSYKNKKRKRDAEENYMNNVAPDDSSLICPVKEENDQKGSSVTHTHDDQTKRSKKKKRKGEVEDNIDDSSMIFPEDSQASERDETKKSNKKKKEKEKSEVEKDEKNVTTDDSTLIGPEDCQASEHHLTKSSKKKKRKEKW